MGTHVFRWHEPAEDVYVTGTFDNWSKSVQLTKDSGIFTKQVDLPSASQDVFYKFVVDGKWRIDESQSKAKDHEGNENNVLRKEDIETLPVGGRAHAGAHPNPNTVSAVRSGIGPGATSAALAGAVPLEKNKSSAHMPGEFPTDSPARETPGGSHGPSAMDFFSPGDIVPDFSTYKSATAPTDPKTSKGEGTKNTNEKAAEIGGAATGAVAAAGATAAVSAKALGEKAKIATGTGESAKGDSQTFSVNPLPATSGIGNPIHAKPGESLPPSEKYSANTTASTVKLDKESYEKSDAYPTSESKPADTGSTSATTGAALIPESGGLPMGDRAVSEGPADVAAIRSAAGHNTTAAELAGQQPIEPRGVPEVVRDSQKEAHASAEASSNPIATAEKSEVEKELKEKVPEEKPTSEVSTFKSAAAGIAGAGAAVASGAAAYAAGIPSTVSNAFSNSKDNSAAQQTADAVPETVKESEKAANSSPEAAANPEAVREKSAVEQELTSKIPLSEAAGAPAPTIASATATTAPHPQSGAEGGQANDQTKDVEPSSNQQPTPKDSSEDKGLLGSIAAGVTGAAAAVGDAAYAASQSGKEKIQEVTGSTASGQPSAGNTISSSSAFANDPIEAEDMRSKDSGNKAVVSSSPVSKGEKDTVPTAATKKSGSAFGDDPTIADEGTAPAIAAATGASMIGVTDPTTSASKNEPAETIAKDRSQRHIGAGSTTATGARVATAVNAGALGGQDRQDNGSLNATKEQPAQTVATEATQIASEPENKTSAASTQDKAATKSSALPGTTMLADSSKAKPRADSRDVSPMTRPEVTTGAQSASIPAKTEGKKGHSRTDSSLTTGSTAEAAQDKKNKRRSFFGKIKDKLKHHEN